MSSKIEKIMQAGERVLLVGPPGCAKTARIRQAAKNTGIVNVFTYCAGLGERVDLAGCYVPDVAAGVTRTLPLDMLDQLSKATEPTLLFLDDLGAGPIDVQAAIKSQITLGGALQKNPNILVWGATNRPGDKAGVSALCEPLRSEFALAFAIATPGTDDKPDGATMLGSWKEEVDGWVEWAFDQDADPAVIAWHRSTTGRTLYQWKPCADPGVRMPDFRSWATVIRLFKHGMADLSTVGAAIGKPAAAELLAFVRLADKLPSPEEVWMSPDSAKIPDAGDSSSLYLCAGMLSASVTDKHAGAFCRYIDRLPRVFGALAGRDAHKRLGAKLTGNREWAKWFLKNEALFAVGAK